MRHYIGVETTDGKQIFLNVDKISSIESREDVSYITLQNRQTYKVNVNSKVLMMKVPRLKYKCLWTEK